MIWRKVVEGERSLNAMIKIESPTKHKIHKTRPYTQSLYLIHCRNHPEAPTRCPRGRRRRPCGKLSYNSKRRRKINPPKNQRKTDGVMFGPFILAQHQHSTCSISTWYCELGDVFKRSHQQQEHITQVLAHAGIKPRLKSTTT